MSQLADLALFMEQRFAPIRVTARDEPDGSTTIRTPCVYCNLTLDTDDHILTIVNIVVTPRLQRTGIGAGTRFVRQLIAYTDEASLLLHAYNVQKDVVGFWQQEVLGFCKLPDPSDRWQRYPVPETLVLVDIANECSAR